MNTGATITVYESGDKAFFTREIEYASSTYLFNCMAPDRSKSINSLLAKKWIERSFFQEGHPSQSNSGTSRFNESNLYR